MFLLGRRRAQLSYYHRDESGETKPASLITREERLSGSDRREGGRDKSKGRLGRTFLTASGPPHLGKSFCQIQTLIYIHEACNGSISWGEQMSLNILCAVGTVERGRNQEREGRKKRHFKTDRMRSLVVSGFIRSNPDFTLDFPNLGLA